MDEEFLKERALHIRNLADKADPFIRRRLLDLALSYEGRVKQPSRATVTLLSNLPSESTSAQKT
jgi:hypothetical protein